MAIENERKYIIDMELIDIDSITFDYDGEHYMVTQSYVDDGRIRKTENIDGSIDYIFTWKKRKDNGSCIEIETIITIDDYIGLLAVSTNTITKYRIKMIHDGLDWDIDFLFKDNGKYDHYLTIAEVEMPEDQEIPENLPYFVSRNLIYLIPRNLDDLWTNKKLSDIDYTKQLIIDTSYKIPNTPVEISPEAKKRSEKILDEIRTRTAAKQEIYG